MAHSSETTKMTAGQWLMHVLHGALIGVGAILPGVSGGVMCVLFGIYQPMMALLSHPGKAFRQYSRLFIPVLIGCAIGFVGLSKVVELAFGADSAIVTCLFFGLILGTIPSLWREAGLKGRNARCGWAGTDELYVKYHDEEWGKPVDDDRILFEFLVLESAQAGLSWITILRKREGYRKAFHRFDPERVAQMTPEEVDRLMRFDGIVRNRLKITAAINNAKLFRAIQKEFGSFYEYVLSFFPGRQPIVNDFKSLSQIPATSPESDAMSRDMKKRGFKFFGSTICYAFLQATGFVNDHLTGCRCKGGRQQTAP